MRAVLDDKLNLDANTVAVREKGGSASVLYEEAASKSRVLL